MKKTKLTVFGIMMISIGILLFIELVMFMSSLLIGSTITTDYLAHSIAITLLVFVIGILLHVAGVPTHKPLIHIKKVICCDECESAEYLNCDKAHCPHSRPHTRLPSCDRVGCVPIERRKT